MKNLIVIYYIVLSNCLLAQTKQSYSGAFTDDNGMQGTANYTYYEKNYERIKDGSFESMCSSNGVVKKLKVSFKDGLRNGVFTLSVTSSGMSINVNGEYVNGVVNGLWLYSAASKGETYRTASVQFSKGLLIGNFRFEDKLYGMSFGNQIFKKVEGVLDEKGFMSGDWKVITNKYEKLYNYDEGHYTLGLVRDLGTGNINSKEEFSEGSEPYNDTTSFDIYSEDDLYGYIVQHEIFNDFMDFKSVGGHVSGMMKGLRFIKYANKKTLSQCGCAPLANIRDDGAQKSILAIENLLIEDQNLLIKNQECIDKNKYKILESQIASTEALTRQVDSFLVFTNRYKFTLHNYDSILSKVDFASKQLEVVEATLDEIKKIKFFEKEFDGLTIESLKYKVRWDNLQKLTRKNAVRMSNISLKDLKSKLELYSDPLDLINDSLSFLENLVQNIYSTDFIMPITRIKTNLIFEIDRYDKFKYSCISIKNSDKLLEKVNVVYEMYFKLLTDKYSIEVLDEFVIKLTLIMDKLQSIINSSDQLSVVLKALKKAETPEIFEKIILESK